MNKRRRRSPAGGVQKTLGDTWGVQVVKDQGVRSSRSRRRGAVAGADSDQRAERRAREKIASAHEWGSYVDAKHVHVDSRWSRESIAIRAAALHRECLPYCAGYVGFDDTSYVFSPRPPGCGIFAQNPFGEHGGGGGGNGGGNGDDRRSVENFRILFPERAKELRSELEIEVLANAVFKLRFQRLDSVVRHVGASAEEVECVVESLVGRGLLMRPTKRHEVHEALARLAKNTLVEMCKSKGVATAARLKKDELITFLMAENCAELEEIRSVSKIANFETEFWPHMVEFFASRGVCPRKACKALRARSSLRMILPAMNRRIDLASALVALKRSMRLDMAIKKGDTRVGYAVLHQAVDSVFADPFSRDVDYSTTLRGIALLERAKKHSMAVHYLEATLATFDRAAKPVPHFKAFATASERYVVDLKKLKRYDVAIKHLKSVMHLFVEKRDDGRLVNVKGMFGCFHIRSLFELCVPPRVWRKPLHLASPLGTARTDHLQLIGRDPGGVEEGVRKFFVHQSREFSHGVHSENVLFQVLKFLFSRGVEPNADCILTTHATHVVGLAASEFRNAWFLTDFQVFERILRGLGTVFLSCLYKLLVEEDGFDLGGAPDLMMWNDSYTCLIEVKGPGDSLSDKQRALLDRLHAVAPRKVRVVHVTYPD